MKLSKNANAAETEYLLNRKMVLLSKFMIHSFNTADRVYLLIKRLQYLDKNLIIVPDDH